MAQTNRVIIHHEGGGAPRDEWACIDAEPYSIAIGKTRIEVRNSPNDSFITNGTSGHSLQVCLTGNRDNYPVTDNDLKLIDEACDVAQSKNWIPAPGQRTCQFHGDTAATACPGAQTRERRDDIYAVVKGGAGPEPEREAADMWSQTVTIDPGDTGQLAVPAGGKNVVLRVTVTRPNETDGKPGTRVTANAIGLNAKVSNLYADLWINAYQTVDKKVDSSTFSGVGVANKGDAQINATISGT